MTKFIFTGMIFFIMVSMLYSSSMGWENNQVIINENGFKPAIAAFRNFVFVAYLKKTGENKQVFLLASEDQGRTWKSPIAVTKDSSQCDDPEILYVNNKVYIFWVDHKDGNNEIYFTYSDDEKGTELKDPVRVTFSESDTIQPHITSTGDKIFLVYVDDKEGDYELFGRTYVIMDNEFSDEVQITFYSGGSFYPNALSMLDEIHLVWQKKDGERWKVMYSKSLDGIQWTPAIDISAGLDSGYEPRLSFSQSGLKVVFQAEHKYEFEIYTATYEELSDHWLIPMKLSRNVNVENSPTLLAVSDRLYAFWYDYSEGNNEIICTSSTDDGLLWTERVNLSETPQDSHEFDLIYNSFNDNTYLVWEEGNAGQVVFKQADRYCPTPSIIASTYKSNEWSFEKDSFFKWKIDSDGSGVKDYAYLIDKEPDTAPDLFIAEYPVDEAKFYNLQDGIWYFHLRARDNMGNLSETVHYPIKINSKMYLEKVVYYVVKYGDTLWDICEKQYGNPRMYNQLAKYNEIKNPRWIYPHQVIKIPPKGSLGK
ncbi:MAG: LysM peptidoglycan-binding domain-containing protein [Spirochaetes bacterium]|nr:LysM peptidoglycan-binding domain-containing protein [Spirochaetota bacterium]